MKLKFEEAISVPVSQRRSVAESIDYHTIGITLMLFLFLFLSLFNFTVCVVL